MMNRVSLSIVATIPALLLGSCAVDKFQTKAQGELDDRSRYTTNAVKILNRIRCKWKTCSKEDELRIWKACLDDGYVTKRDASQIISARSIIELTTNTYRYTEMKPEVTTDPNGVVGTTEVMLPQEMTSTVEGYCIGSEYIVKEQLSARD